MLSGIVTMQKIPPLRGLFYVPSVADHGKSMGIIHGCFHCPYGAAGDPSGCCHPDCPPLGENDAVRSVTVPAVSGPRAGIPSGRRDCNGIPLNVGDTVAFLDTEPMQIVGFVDDSSAIPRFVYALIASPSLELRTFPCVAVTLVKPAP